MRKSLIAAGLLACAVSLTACGSSGIVAPSRQDTVSYEVKEQVGVLRLRNGAGDAKITETGDGAVHVIERLHWRGDARPETEHKVEGAALVIGYRCPPAWSCGVDYEIQVPKGLALDLQSGAGDLTLRGLSGDLALSVGSGNVDAADLAGRKVTAETGTGDIELRYVSAPDAVELTTGAGDVQLAVPDVGPYAVRTEAAVGDTAVSVRKDDASPRKISVSAGAGDVTVSPA
ncbi:Putative adhesin [Nonomuraea maritima]|uniref:Putative adhesin n=1 Tax=Nonomuraea maritima TaxID=683260 RepID=A0A1G8T1B1_9ACTN|nr:DUF4097 family beta strand repeat-containing protein [Nonomuraea maritima]SDJ35251.1 Putative adhesin [Nonomuraea maritima]